MASEQAGNKEAAMLMVRLFVPLRNVRKTVRLNPVRLILVYPFDH